MVNMEKDIELELSKLSLPDSESPAEDVEEDYDSFMVIEEFPESVLSFLQSVKQRSEKAEKLILEDLDSTDTWTSDCFPVSYKHQVTNDSDYFVQLASENHEDPETFKKRVLAEIEEDDRKDLLSCDNPEIEDADVSKGDAELVNKLDGVDEVLNFCYTEVEESCRQKLQQWQKEQENHKEVDRAALNAQKAVLEKEIKEQDEKRENWEREFEKELSKLSTFQQKQQEKLELDLKRNYEALEQDLQYHQVTTVTLHDLPGCSLSTLSKCVNLKFLSLRRCQLSALEGLSNCKALQYLDVQDNCISFINCEGLENLVVLLLNKNRVTSINGIEDCKNLMTLELSFNSVTRIAGLESLRNLQWLALDHNQLISTKALETTPQLTYLDCSYNYLTELEGIQNCGLLQILKLQGNNLSEIPRLDNHVLMRELYLDDNNLTTMTDMSSYWLPLLQVFTVSQNSITHLEPFNTFISLEELNLSSNCLSDLETVTLWLEGCMNLRKLSISKNPFLQEHNWRFTLQKTLPALRCLNDEEITSEDTPFHKSPPGSFMAFCQHQISNIHKLWHVIDEERQSPSLEKLDMYCNSLKEILQLSNVYRYAHEYGDTDVAEREDPENQLHLDNSQHSSHIILGPHEDQCEDTKQITIQHAKSLLEQSFVNAEQSDRANNRGSMKYQSKLSVTSTRKDIKGHSREVSAAVLIQSQWRGYIVRRDIHYYTKLHEAASLIQSAWRYYYSRKKSLHKKCANPKTFKVREQAATVIQAAWKGFFLRKKLAAAFAGIDREELEDDFEEVNLDEFTFDENVFEKGWSVDSALSHSGALHIFSKPERPKKTVLEEDREYSLPWSPQEAWAVSEGSTLDKKHRYEKDGLSGRSEKHNLSHVYSMKSNTDISFKSEKEEKISQEWGFKEVSTAQLMLKRAQKMKSKQAKHKKMLDPAVRLALFKNNENKHSPVMPPKKAQPTKIEYIQGKEEELCYLKELPSEALARSRELTYQWLHTQYGNINTTSTAISKCKGFLPELNHDVLHGGRVQLVAKEPLSKEADDIDLMSLKSGSTLSQNREEKVKTQRSSGTLSNRNVCVPVKTNTGPQRKERISFRDNPVQLSGGWGGGKKKGKAVK
ncbi:leucine-rich repeat and IQ domain-containing protein 1 isoform X2 [Hyla sarda]|uniref:leucine-rich repeat and IQ domain-containing protein 1 isoform X2 n=1 Tax=Hyla sarda TaxID=327740 RepID=UPI0024C4557D|nr:leucine-rich repeat and IQ domain-containing protein 1 isoform X2 [Hyla sarda]